MATVSQLSQLRFSQRDCFFLNKANPDLVESMVLNSVNSVVNKSQNEVYSIKMPTSESSKMETRKILSQEITLTSKAPLKILELLESSTNSGNIDDCLIAECCKYLKKKGKELDNGPNSIALNHYFETMRNLSRNLAVDSASRTKLLEIIELRSLGWRTPEEMAAYYATTERSCDNQHQSPSNLSTSASSTTLSTTNSNIIISNNNNNNVKQSSPESTDSSMSPSSSGDVIKHSGKFQKPVKVPGKNFVKDEFIIKNCDSGKVNPGAKDRLLQITGPDESSINKAKYYIGDTIKRNASPIPCDQQPPQPQTHHQQQPVPLNLSRHITSFSTPAVHKLLAEGQFDDGFVQTITVGSEVLVISSSQPILTKEAKSVLEKYFQRSQTDPIFKTYAESESDDSEISVKPAKSNGSNSGVTSSNNHANIVEKKYQKSASHGSLASSNGLSPKLAKITPKDVIDSSRKIVYDREFLLKCAKSELSKVQSNAIKLVTQQIPDIARKSRQARANSVESAVA
ncbi:uncharacterized protein LOC128394224 isoform X2 [Panonychus citri]|uniref:uncharacterized protein LOC128394224 isoform X2 n=1 Tax=Panonychus citri TaxID=50023 RepID=UPI002306F76A|nr:uncharacterized protein LOC128394224 isoform X2 [Panonychus citri]